MHVSTKRLLSILLCLAMVLALLPMAVFAETATILYVQPNSNWNEANARFAAYFFGNGDTWADCTDADGDGIYEVEVPAGFTSVIFCRMNPGAAENTWDNKWNQTSDLAIPADGTNCYVVEDGSWDNGQWTTYVPGGEVVPTEPTEPSTEPTTPVEPAEVAYCLVGWINGADYGCNDDWENVGKYIFVDGKLTATFESDSYVFVKTTDNSKWLLSESFCTSASCTFVEGAGEKMRVPANQELTFTLVENEDGSVTVNYTKASGECAHVYQDTVVAPTCDNNGYTIHECTLCGYKFNDSPVNPIGHDYITNVIAPNCTQEGYTIYSCLNCGDTYNWNTVPAVGHSYVDGVCSVCGDTDSSYVPVDVDYYLFGYIDGADYGIGEDIDNIGEYKFCNGHLTVTFKEDSYVAVKTGDNSAFFMTNGWVGSATSATLYKFTDPYAASANKLLIPGGQTVTFTLTENWDGNLKISYIVESSSCVHVQHDTDGICTTCGATVEHTFVSGVCTICGISDENYNPFDFYLYGYINGANYGCEEDAANLGEYKFVNGTLTATFTADSYVGVKEVYPYGKFGPEVIGWYMTDGWLGTETTTATMYKSGDIATGDKLFVPGGVELTFTMKVDGRTVILSYDKGGCTHDYSEEITAAAGCLTAGTKTFTCTKCGYSYNETIPATGHNYADGKCTGCGIADPSVSGANYCLVGWINGADYGCNDDWENVGQYVFTNGKLTTKFDAESYVFVKSTDCTKWYLANAFCEDTTCTFVEGGTEKMKVPGGVALTFTLTENEDGSVTVSYTTASASVVPTLTLKSPTLEFKDMITVNAMFTAENIDDVVEMGMITYSSKVASWSVATAEHVVPGTTYDVNTGRYIAHSQGIHAKYLGDTVYLAVYAKLADGTYAYSSKLAPYSPVQYATSQLKNSSDVKLKQLVAAMLNYGAEAQKFFGHNTGNLANASLTADQKALPEAYRADMVSAVPNASAAKQGTFANNKGFEKRYPAISFEGAFCINYFFKPNYAPDNGITLYYWNAADYNAASVLTTANASGSLKLALEDSGEYRGDIVGISAKNLSEAVYVAAVYENGGTTWTSGVLGYSIGAYCSSQASKGADVAGLAMATAVYGYHAKAYFG